MKLYIVRHGIAEERGARGVPDAERALTPEGRSRSRLAAKGVAVLGCRPARIATSSLRRAQETARIFAAVLCPQAEPEVCSFLSPGGEFGDLVSWLEALKEDSVMVVGHMPDVARFASGLLWKGSELDITFRKAGVCCIFLHRVPSAEPGRLEWLLQPAQLCALARK